jgi:glycosyltransferase involved in cell wall biosynthesis
MEKYSVVIPTLWKSDKTEKLIKDLIECEYVDEIIVIDNTKNEECDVSHPTTHSKIRLVCKGENIYVNPAWNWGVELSKNEHIAICNDDINFNPNIFESILSNNIDGIIGQSSNNFNKNQEGLPSVTLMQHSRPWGWGTLILTQKKYWIPIPEQLKVWYGDDFFCIKNPCKKWILNNFEITTNMSTTSNLPEFNSIKHNDGIEWTKLL